MIPAVLPCHHELTAGLDTRQDHFTQAPLLQLAPAAPKYHLMLQLLDILVHAAASGQLTHLVFWELARPLQHAVQQLFLACLLCMSCRALCLTPPSWTIAMWSWQI